MRVAGKYIDLDKKAQRYFDECDAMNIGQKNIVKPYTVSGLIYSLGLTRSEFDKLLEKPKYAFLANAKARIEAFIEENSLNGGLSFQASASSLKYNFGWGEKSPDEKGNDVRELEISLAPEAKRLAK